MDEKDELIGAINKSVDIQLKLNEMLQAQQRQTERLEFLTQEVRKLVDHIDGYPLKTLDKLEQLKDKVSGEEGLRVQLNQHFSQLKVLVRNWQLLASTIIAVLFVILKLYL